MKYEDLIEILKDYHQIVVTGPHRTGTPRGKSENISDRVKLVKYLT